MKVISHSWYLAVRDIRNLLRQPWYVAITLVQPMVWLFLFACIYVWGTGGGRLVGAE